jgi:putative endonuclease
VSQLSGGHFVYLVRCANGALYAGYAVDVPRRVAAHNAGRGSRYTRAHRPVALVAVWSFASRSDALRAEALLKRRSHAEKRALAASGNFLGRSSETFIA